MTLSHSALAGLKTIYRAGFAYTKAGVMLSELIPAKQRIPTLFDDPAQLARSTALMQALDRINQAYGQGTIKLAGEGLAFASVTLPKQLRETRIVKDAAPDAIAKEIVEWIRS